MKFFWEVSDWYRDQLRARLQGMPPPPRPEGVFDAALPQTNLLDLDQAPSRRHIVKEPIKSSYRILMFLVILQLLIWAILIGFWWIYSHFADFSCSFQWNQVEPFLSQNHAKSMIIPFLLIKNHHSYENPHNILNLEDPQWRERSTMTSRPRRMKICWRSTDCSRGCWTSASTLHRLTSHLQLSEKWNIWRPSKRIRVISS